MHTIDDLNVKLVSELRTLADEFGISDASKFPKKELIYKILDKQAVMPGNEGDTPTADQSAVISEPVRKTRRTKPVASVDTIVSDPPGATVDTTESAPAESPVATVSEPAAATPDVPVERTRQRIRRDAGTPDRGTPDRSPQDAGTLKLVFQTNGTDDQAVAITANQAEPTTPAQEPTSQQSNGEQVAQASQSAPASATATDSGTERSGSTVQSRNSDFRPGNSSTPTERRPGGKTARLTEPTGNRSRIAGSKAMRAPTPRHRPVNASPGPLPTIVR